MITDTSKLNELLTYIRDKFKVTYAPNSISNPDERLSYVELFVICSRINALLRDVPQAAEYFEKYKLVECEKKKAWSKLPMSTWIKPL